MEKQPFWLPDVGRDGWCRSGRRKSSSEATVIGRGGLWFEERICREQEVVETWEITGKGN